jgi:hypothetical protein
MNKGDSVGDEVKIKRLFHKPALTKQVLTKRDLAPLLLQPEFSPIFTVQMRT